MQANKRKVLIFSVFPLTLIALSLTTSCGGSNSGNEQSEGGNSKIRLTKTYLPFKGSSKLVVVDPDTTAQITVSNNKTITDAKLLLKAIVNPADLTNYYIDLHPTKVIWIEKNSTNSKIFSANIELNGIPNKKRISSINDACNFVGYYTDIKNGIGYMEVRAAGEDGECDTQDDEFYLINTETPDDENGVYLANQKILGSYINPNGYYIEGFFLKDERSKKFVYSDTDFSDLKYIVSYQNDVKQLGVTTKGFSFFCIDGKLYKVKPTPQVHNIGLNCTNWKYPLIDDKNLYVLQNGRILKLPLEGNSTEVVYNGTDATYLYSVSTKEYLIVKTGNSTNYDILTVPKEKGGITKIIATAVGNQGIDVVVIGEDKVFLNEKFDDIEKACWWTKTKGIECITNAKIIGFTIKPIGKILFEKGMYYPVQLYKILVDKKDANGRKLISIDFQSLKQKEIATFNGTFSFSFLGAGIGNRLLLTGINSNQTDVFYIDLSKENSLTNITNTPNENEVGIYSIF